MKKNDFQNLDAKAIREKVNTLRKEFFDLKLSVASTPIKDNSQFKKLRASIARGLTTLRTKLSEEVK